MRRAQRQAGPRPRRRGNEAILEQPPRATARLLLPGVGHAHLRGVRRQSEAPLPVEVISAGARQHHSGMVPGHCSEDQVPADDAALVGGGAAGGRAVETGVG